MTITWLTLFLIKEALWFQAPSKDNCPKIFFKNTFNSYLHLRTLSWGGKYPPRFSPHSQNAQYKKLITTDSLNPHKILSQHGPVPINHQRTTERQPSSIHNHSETKNKDSTDFLLKILLLEYSHLLSQRTHPGPKTAQNRSQEAVS